MIQLDIFQCHLYVCQQQEMILLVSWNRPKCKSPRYKHMTYDVLKAHSLACVSRSQCAIKREFKGGDGEGVYYVTRVSNTIMQPYYECYSCVHFCFLT